MTKREKLLNIEAEIVSLDPNPQQMVGIVHALQRSLELQRGDEAVDAREAASELCSALDALDEIEPSLAELVEDRDS